MNTKPPGAQWRFVGTVPLRNVYRVERTADVFRVSSATPRHAEFGEEVRGEVARYLAKTLSGQTVTVEGAEDLLRKCGLSLPYTYGYKLHFFAQNALVVLVASGQASHTKVGKRFEYHIA